MSANFSHQGKQKKEYVKQMFNDISGKYDIFNLLSSFGIDRYWRNRLINKFNLSSHNSVLDVATGTGDVAFGIYKKYKSVVTGIDIAQNMISIAKRKAIKYKTDKLSFLVGDAEKLPFNTNSYDGLTISFGFRNLGDYDKSLSEFYRVLDKNGKIAILEFSKPSSNWFNPLFRFYFTKIIPILGSMLSRKDAFVYLPESVDYFPSRDEICNKMKLAGFKNIEYSDYTFGISTIYTGVKIDE